MLDGVSDLSWNRRSSILAFVASIVSRQHDTSIHFALFVTDKVLNLSHFAELQNLVRKDLMSISEVNQMPL